MDKTFNISVRDRLAKNLSHLDYVCGNTGYMVRFDFDEEWDAYPIKTAHFIESSGKHHNAAVIDNQCEFPQIMNTIRVEVGVYAGDLYVTTPAVIGARRSILSTGGDRPAVPEENEYDKMMEAINQDAVRAENAADEAEKAAEEAKKAAEKAEGGGGGAAIIDVVALPTENIDKTMLYRLLTGTFYRYGGAFNAYTCEVVETLPETGKPVTDATMWEFYMYYSLDTKSLHGYVPDALGAVLDIPAGWCPSEQIFSIVYVNYGGIIVSPKDAVIDDTVYLLLEGTLYQYNDQWFELNQVGWRGGENSAEIFNSLQNVANGKFSHAEGFKTVAGRSHMEGENSHAEGRYSHAEGYSSHAEGDCSHAKGYGSHAEGNGSHAEGDGSHAEGSGHAEGNRSHAEGAGTHAEGFFSHAEGRGLNVSMPLSGTANSVVYTSILPLPKEIFVGMTLRMHIAGGGLGNEPGYTFSTAKVVAFDTKEKTITVDRTLSEFDDVELANTIGYYGGMALGDYSHVEGNGNIAAGQSQHVEGEYNRQDPWYVQGVQNFRGKYAHIVGNGTSHENRSNAHTLDWDGNAWYSGDVYVGGEGQDNGKKLATEAYVQDAVHARPENAGKLLYVADDGSLQPLALGAGLTIVDGVLTINATTAKAIAGMALAGQVYVGEV